MGANCNWGSDERPESLKKGVLTAGHTRIALSCECPPPSGVVSHYEYKLKTDNYSNYKRFLYSTLSPVDLKMLNKITSNKINNEANDKNVANIVLQSKRDKRAG